MSDDLPVKLSQMRFDPYTQLEFCVNYSVIKYVLYTFSITEDFNIHNILNILPTPGEAKAKAMPGRL